MFQIKNKVVVVTGASQGIGKHISIEVAKKGAIVVMIARSLKKLKKVELTIKSTQGVCFLIVGDITSKNSVKQSIQKVIEKFGRVDILINNAAIGLFETVADSEQKDIKKVFDTNFFGPIYCIQFVIPHMRKRKKGMIVNISSAISKYSMYHQGIYSASKAALERITEAIGIEEIGFGVKTLLIIPDRTRTQFRNHVAGPKRFARLPFKLPESDPRKVAKKILLAIIKEKNVFHTTIRSRIYHIATAICPKLVGQILERNHYKFLRNIK